MKYRIRKRTDRTNNSTYYIPEWTESWQDRLFGYWHQGTWQDSEQKAKDIIDNLLQRHENPVTNEIIKYP